MNDFKWVCQAVPNRVSQKYPQIAYSDGATLWATDGWSAHWAPTVLPRGYYTTEGMYSPECPNFPDISAVVPSDVAWSGMVNIGTMPKAGDNLVTFQGVTFNRRRLLEAFDGATELFALMNSPERYRGQRVLHILNGARQAMVISEEAR